MQRSHIVVVSGLPAAGKTSVASILRQQLSWPLLAKDDIKEQLFDALGVGDADWSKRLSLTSYGVLFTVARQLANAGASCIIEGNFRWEQTRASFEALANDCRFTQVWCTADEQTLMRRLQARAEHGVRHEGHRDREQLPTLVAEMQRTTPEPLPLPGQVITIDTAGLASDLELKLRQLAEKIRKS